jgi:hypothetical protein
VPAGKGSRFEANVRALLADQEGLAPILLPLLEAGRAVRLRAAERSQIPRQGLVSWKTARSQVTARGAPGLKNSPALRLSPIATAFS